MWRLFSSSASPVGQPSGRILNETIVLKKVKKDETAEEMHENVLKFFFLFHVIVHFIRVRTALG